jgi:nicotinamidase-related amidase
VPELVSPKTHAWHIAEREYARHEQRRGRRHAYVRIEPTRTALVVIDMVSFFVEDNEFCRGVVPNIGSLARSLRAAGGAVAWVLPGQPPPSSADEEFFGTEVAEMYRKAGGDGPLRERLWHELEVFEGDIIVEKTARSAFFPGRSPLPAALDARGIDTVLITGTLTNVCCESSARDASTLGYRVLMVADANAARRDQDHNATLHTVYRSFGDVRPTSDVLGLIQAGSAR